ncbi:MAG: prepilin-type N-terminal cleavage/methylation domain-containing protein [Campylobacterota bacterium]|nr:prepilin-type N-terminal cleavage/methylation domain-containing protein [Campylobacterota bacterium]
MRHFKPGFTLMELMISVVLIVLIVLFMYGAVASSKLSNERILFHDTIEANRTKIFRLLYNDFLQSQNLVSEEGEKRNYNIVRMQTHNTLHQIPMPYVVYFVHSRTNALTRLEAARPIELPIKYDNQQSIHADIILKDVSDFNIYTGGSTETNSSEEQNTSTSSSHKSMLIYLNKKSWSKSMLFELSF